MFKKCLLLLLTTAMIAACSHTSAKKTFKSSYYGNPTTMVQFTRNTFMEVGVDPADPNERHFHLRYPTEKTSRFTEMITKIINEEVGFTKFTLEPHTLWIWISKAYTWEEQLPKLVRHFEDFEKAEPILPKPKKKPAPSNGI
jgi:hypothetical protein